MPNLNISFKAKALYQNSITENLHFSNDKKGLVLANTVVVEDDAPGAVVPGCHERVAGSLHLKKELSVDNPATAKAWILIFREVPSQEVNRAGRISIGLFLNGHPVTAALGPYWNYIEVDPALLVVGVNQVVVTAAEETPVLIPLVSRGSIIENEAQRFDFPQRSYKSSDGGESWCEELGEHQKVQGEYRVRLHLAQFAKTGTLVSPVIDLADVRDRDPVKTPVTIGSFQGGVEKELPPDTELMYYYRSGTTPVFSADTWQDWVHTRPEEECSLAGRYFQGKILFKTGNPLASPVIRKLEIKSSYKKVKETEGERINIEQFRSFRIIRSSIPFRYEILTHRFLKQLRDRYGLDQVVSGAKNLFETIIRLSQWTAQQEQCRQHRGEPVWNALEILGRPAGETAPAFCCGQFALVLVQCCLAFGIQARLVAGNISRLVPGHQMAEVWSDDYGKWILMDPALDRYFLDKKTVVPLNALEVQKRVMQYFRRTGKGKGALPDLKNLTDEKCRRYLEQAGIVCRQGEAVNTEFMDPLPEAVSWGSLRIIPRNNFFSEKYPIPRMAASLNECSWNGWYHWADEKLPRELQFGRWVDKPGDCYWSVNQIAICLQATGAKGVLQVCLDTHTPELDSFLAAIDDEDWKETDQHFTWQLKEGPNQLKAKVRNRGGVEGMESIVKLHYSSQ